MSRKIIKITAFLTAMSCVTALASCGNDVPQAETSDVSGGFSITGGEQDEESTTTSAMIEISEATTATSSTGTDNNSTETTTTTQNYSLVTRSPEELATTKKPVVATKPVRTTVAVPNAPAGTSSVITGNAPTVTTASANTDPAVTTTGSSTLSGITLSYYSAEVSVGQTIQYPVVSENITEIWTSSDDNIASVDAYGNITGKGEGNCIIRVVSADNSNIGAEVKVTVKKSEGIQQIDGITYADGILIANKTYGLPSTYNPQGLTDDTYSAFQTLSNAASNAGLNIYLSSGFRSYETQDQIYNNYVYSYGQETADTFSARPGYSEHQTGLAIDVNTIDDSFADTAEAVWLEEHCIEYGFIIRYPKGKDSVTGYKYEPWHIRYVGKEVAQAIHDAGVACGDPTITLEEYLGITSVYQ